MSKTPEQMAEEFFENWQPEKPKYIRPKARQYALEKVTECFLAGYQAAMNSPEKPDSCEHILDMEKMVDADKVTPKQDVTLLHKVANNYLDRKAAKYRRVCGYKK